MQTADDLRNLSRSVSVHLFAQAEGALSGVGPFRDTPPRTSRTDSFPVWRLVEGESLRRGRSSNRGNLALLLDEVGRSQTVTVLARSSVRLHLISQYRPSRLHSGHDGPPAGRFQQMAGFVERFGCWRVCQLL